jgi:hypothetical protein
VVATHAGEAMVSGEVVGAVGAAVVAPLRPSVRVMPPAVVGALDAPGGADVVRAIGHW